MEIEEIDEETIEEELKSSRIPKKSIVEEKAQEYYYERILLKSIVKNYKYLRNQFWYQKTLQLYKLLKKIPYENIEELSLNGRDKLKYNIEKVFIYFKI